MRWAGIYIESLKSTLDQWLDLRFQFKMRARKSGYEGRRQRREASLRQESSEKKLLATLAD